MRLGTTAVRVLSQVGVAPKGVSLEDLSLAPGPYGCSCSAMLDA
jgi:hypothetical protein